MKVLFTLPHLSEAASSRYRVYQYLPYLAEHGVEATVRPFVSSPDFYRLLYRPGQVPQKAAYTLAGAARRLLDLARARNYDLVFIQREALPFGPAWFERLVHALGKPVVFDFDDAIYLPNTSRANRWISFLKRPQKTAGIIRLSRCVIAGNEHLSRYARQFSPNVTVIPTSIDTARYTLSPRLGRQPEPVVIGWVGGHSTLDFLHPLHAVFQRLAALHPIRVVVVGGSYDIPGVEVECRPWKLENEIADLHTFDIGIMPMPDNEWTRGKCGFKAIQYMGVGIPAVASPVGVNRQIVRHGENGFLANTEAEWLEALLRLVRDHQLRQRLGLAGRVDVEAKYSLKVHAPRLLQVLQEVGHASTGRSG